MFEDLSSSSSVKLPDTSEESVGRVLHEMEALNACMAVCDGQGSPEEAKLLCRTYLGRLDPSTVEEYVTEAALLHILDRSVELADPWSHAKSWEEQVAEAVALAWLSLISGDADDARVRIMDLRAKRKAETFHGKSGALHLLTLAFWSEAILLTAAGDHTGARRYYKRALEYGAQLGTDSHPMISWAYAATFFTSAM
jgi:hypothetical protein